MRGLLLSLLSERDLRLLFLFGERFKGGFVIVPLLDTCCIPVTCLDTSVNRV